MTASDVSQGSQNTDVIKSHFRNYTQRHSCAVGRKTGGNGIRGWQSMEINTLPHVTVQHCHKKPSERTPLKWPLRNDLLEMTSFSTASEEDAEVKKPSSNKASSEQRVHLSMICEFTQATKDL